MSRSGPTDRLEVTWPPGFSPDGATMHHDPRHTIRPRTAAPDTARRTAVGALSQLAGTSTLGRKLVLGEVLGQGGMAVVRSATQVSLGRKVAVKSLPPDRQARQHPASDSVVELMQEAWITGALEHPNVVPIYDVEFDDRGNPLVLLKHIEGQPWRELMSERQVVRERFGATDLLEWNLGVLMQVLNAVRFAHSRGIIHRDLKPDNVMIGEYGEVYLVDWGIALSLRDDGSGRLPLARDADELAGTPMYMAPEMLPGVRIPLSERTDIYQAGAILYELVTGRPPHYCDTLTELSASVMASNPPLPEHVPPRLAAICRRAMDPDPNGRFENAEQVRLALQGYLRHRGATRLLTEATARLDELQAAVSRAEPDNLDHRQGLYKLYGECRFGFREARTSWKENSEARRGQERAARIMIEYELASGDAVAAATLLADVPEPPASLRQRIDRALEAQEAEKARMARLERLGRAMDMSAGSATRRGLILILGLVWMAVPMFNQWLPEHSLKKTHTGMAINTGMFLALCMLLGLVARRSLFQSLINRRYFAALVFVYLTHGVLQLGLFLAGLPLDLFHLLAFVTTFAIISMLVITMDVRLSPTALAYGAAFLVAARWPELRFYAQSAAAVVLTINTVAIWKPGPASHA